MSFNVSVLNLYVPYVNLGSQRLGSFKATFDWRCSFPFLSCCLQIVVAPASSMFRQKMLIESVSTRKEAPSVKMWLRRTVYLQRLTDDVLNLTLRVWNASVAEWCASLCVCVRVCARALSLYLLILSKAKRTAWYLYLNLALLICVDFLCSDFSPLFFFLAQIDVGLPPTGIHRPLDISVLCQVANHHQKHYISKYYMRRGVVVVILPFLLLWTNNSVFINFLQKHIFTDLFFDQGSYCMQL